MKITKRAVAVVKGKIRARCGSLPEKDRAACRKAAARVGKALARELTRCNRLKGSAARACHEGRIITTRAIAAVK